MDLRTSIIWASGMEIKKKGGHESTRSKMDDRIYKKQDGEKDTKREES